MPRMCQKETRRQKWPRKMTRRSKNTPEQDNRAAGAPKAQTAHKKSARDDTNNDTESKNNVGDYPDACAFSMHKKKDSRKNTGVPPIL